MPDKLKFNYVIHTINLAFKIKKKARHSYICLKARWRRMPSHIEINLSYNQLKREMLYEFYFKLNTQVFWHIITTK